MRFSKTHEWVKVIGEIGTVGISEHAKKELGDIVYIEPPSIKQHIDVGDVVCVIESTKAASDIYSPVSGIIETVNNDFIKDPSWIYTINLSNPREFDSLLTKDEYEKLVIG